MNTYIRIHIYMHIYVCIYLYFYMYTYTHIYVYVRMYIFTYNQPLLGLLPSISCKTLLEYCSRRLEHARFQKG